MDSKIFIILIGIIIYTDGKPSSLGISNENELAKVLTRLYKDGKFDIAFSHHEDGPKTHHEDKARISVHDENPHASHHHHDEVSHDRRHKELFKKYKYSDIRDSSLTNTQNLNLLLKKKLKNTVDENYDDEGEASIGLRSPSNAGDMDEIDQIGKLLTELEKQVSSDNRCGGNRCGRGRANDDDGDDDDETKDDSNRLACIGDTCFRIDDDNEGEKSSKGKLRCFGEACGRSDQRDDDRAACVGNRCGKGRDDDDDNENDDNNNIVRCFGDSCGIDQVLLRERRLPDGDAHIEQLFRSQAQKIKINDDLDAIFLDLSDLKKSLAKDRNEKQANNVQYIKNIDLSSFLDDKIDYDEESVRNQDVSDSESKPIKAVVVDLSKAQSDVSSQIKDLISTLQSPSYMPIKVQTLKKENTLPSAEPKILAHSEENNNVYVPKWLLDEVVTKTNLRDSERKLKSLLPLTARQKEKLMKALAQKSKTPAKRIFRRSIDDDVGVPFHLQVEGLGQVEAQ